MNISEINLELDNNSNTLLIQWIKSFIFLVGANNLWLPKKERCAIKSKPGSLKQDSPIKMTSLNSPTPGTRTSWGWLISAKMSPLPSLSLPNCFKSCPTCTIPTCSKSKNLNSSGNKIDTWKMTLTTCSQSSRPLIKTYIFFNPQLEK